MPPFQVCGGCDYTRFSLEWTIGVVVGAVIFGALVTIGCTCIFLLKRQPSQSPLRFRILSAYVVSLVLLNAAFLVQNFLLANYFNFSFLADRGAVEQLRGYNQLFLSWLLTLGMIAFWTDGLLVWRCYMVQKALSNSQRPLNAGMLFWIFPACLWLGTLVSCVTGGALNYHSLEVTGQSAGLPAGFLTLSTNITLNIYVPIFIIARLVYHHRTLRSFYEKSAETYSTRVAGMLLESAAINVPITIIAALCLAVSTVYGDLVVSMVVPGQSFTALLVMYRVALGKAVGETGSTGTAKPRPELRKRHMARLSTSSDVIVFRRPASLLDKECGNAT